MMWLDEFYHTDILLITTGAIDKKPAGTVCTDVAVLFVHLWLKLIIFLNTNSSKIREHVIYNAHVLLETLNFAEQILVFYQSF